MHPAPQGDASPPARGGFTLIELVLVMVVLALATAIAAPALMPALESVRAEALARRAASFLDEARRRSILRRATVAVTCDREQGTLRMTEEGAPPAEGADGESAEPPPPAPTFRVPERSEIVSCEPEVMSYFPQGYATGGAIVLRDGAGRERRVSVGSFTGLSRVDPAP